MTVKKLINYLLWTYLNEHERLSEEIEKYGEKFGKYHFLTREKYGELQRLEFIIYDIRNIYKNIDFIKENNINIEKDVNEKLKNYKQCDFYTR